VKIGVQQKYHDVTMEKSIQAAREDEYLNGGLLTVPIPDIGPNLPRSDTVANNYPSYALQMS
jgi:hypothetical protein